VPGEGDVGEVSVEGHAAVPPPLLEHMPHLPERVAPETIVLNCILQL